MPVEWEKRPVRMEVRLGQHSGFSTNAFVNVVPRTASWWRTIGMAHRVSQRWSSVSTSTMFGGASAATVGTAAPPPSATRMASPATRAPLMPHTFSRA